MRAPTRSGVARFMLQNIRRASTIAAGDVLRAGRATNVKPFEDIPRVPSFPLIGSSWMYSRLLGKHHPDERHKASMEMYRKYGPIVAETLPGRYSMVHLFAGADIQTLYEEEGKTPFRVGAAAFKYYRRTRPELYADEGILNLQGEAWQKVRSSTQKHTMRVRTTMAYVPCFNLVADDYLALMEELMNAEGGLQHCELLLKRWALEGVALASLDDRLGSLRNPLDKTSDAAEILNDMAIASRCLQKFSHRFPYFRHLPSLTWHRFVTAMDEFITRVLRRIEAAAERLEYTQEEHEPTILEHFMADKKMNFKEILTFTADFILAGVNTTAAAATFLLFHFAKNPNAQQKARQEVLAVLETTSNYVQPQHFEKLPYLKACLKESMRLNPSVPGIYRKLNQDVVMSGYRIPAGVPIFADIFVSGRAEENFERPELFLPERWLKSNQGKWRHHAYASLPFSFGTRMCLGRRLAELQIWILVAKILAKYEVECHNDDIDYITQFNNHPKGPLNFYFKKRNQPVDCS
ncbi:putative cytochrome P450 301a1, mitochondrial [Haemaphysalis longicornis]